MFERGSLREGMIVRSIDGENLGKVYAIRETDFLIEKGLFFPKDYVCRYADISDIRNGEIVLLLGRESLRKAWSDDKYGATAGLGTHAGLGTNAGLTSDRSMRAGEEVTIPVHKEELDVVKRDVQAGEVRVHKEVVTEERVVDVPVRRERVRVERRDVNPDRPAMNASFQEETIVVPVRAEEVDVRKRAVLDEEVVIRKDVVDEERRVAGTVRHEEVDVRTSGETEERTYSAPDDDPLKRR
jgi:uncharacterized protein (TIGR02271 family)